MAHNKFRLRGYLSSDNLPAIKPALERIIADKGTIRQTDQGFEVEAELEGENADLSTGCFCLSYVGGETNEDSL